MKLVDYDAIAPAYDRRYRANRFDGILSTLRNFVGGSDSVAEIGCGTGHWLESLAGTKAQLVGLDASAGMLARARGSAPEAALVRGTADALPFRDHCLPRVFCVNALHHFPDPSVFVRDISRVIQPGGGLLTIGLDPHSTRDQWWVYDYFPDALIADRIRYPSAATLHRMFRDAGFVAVATTMAQEISASVPFESALAQGLVERDSTSQLQVITDAHWEAGLARLRKERPVLRADLRLYSTVGWLP